VFGQPVTGGAEASNESAVDSGHVRTEWSG
jgi:hypothetical protein